MKKTIAFLLAVSALTAALNGCTSTQTTDEGKTHINVGVWAVETQPENLARYEKLKQDFMAQHPDIEIEGKAFSYDTKTFTMKASAGQLPTLYSTWFTEIGMIIKQGYAADITDIVKENKYDEYLNQELMKLVTAEDGKIYGLPFSAYAQGLFVNKAIFEEAGLVNSDGSIMEPTSYQDIAEFSKIIREKTGKSGFAIPTTNNCGGWHFLNIAWSYGVDFMKQRDDGTWEATFNTQEAKDALQYVKDLKWVYNALPDDTVIDQQGLYKYFGVNQTAMMFADPPRNELPQKYGMDIDDIYVTRMPEGPKGRYSQMGGGIYVFSPEATEEQIKAALLWLAFDGFTPDMNEEVIENAKTSFDVTINEGGIVLDREAFPIWIAGSAVEEKKKIREEYANVKPENYSNYYAFEGVTINPEPPVCAQQLYAILDGCIQEVITNENADVDKLIEQACVDFQVNHLDKM